MTRFEYKVVMAYDIDEHSAPNHEKALNDLGKEGWELAAVTERWLVFKRQNIVRSNSGPR